MECWKGAVEENKRGLGDRGWEDGRMGGWWVGKLRCVGRIDRGRDVGCVGAVRYGVEGFSFHFPIRSTFAYVVVMYYRN